MQVLNSIKGGTAFFLVILLIFVFNPLIATIIGLFSTGLTQTILQLMVYLFYITLLYFYAIRKLISHNIKVTP